MNIYNSFEYEGKTYHLRRLDGYDYFHAFELGQNSVGNLGDIYAELIKASVIDDRGKNVFSLEASKKLPHPVLQALAGEILAEHNKFAEEFEDSGVFKLTPRDSQ